MVISSQDILLRENINVHKIYYKYNGHFTRITDQYDYL